MDLGCGARIDTAMIRPTTGTTQPPMPPAFDSPAPRGRGRRDNQENSLYICNIEMPKAKKAEPKRHQGGEIEEVLNSFAEVMSKLMIDDHQEQIAALDLTLLQGQVLRVLRRGAVPTGKLASELQISASAVTQLTDRLIRKELIERQSVTGDRRCVVVGLSSKGKTLIDDFRKRRTVLFSESLSHLSERKHSQVVQAMKLVIGALENSKKSDNKQDS